MGNHTLFATSSEWIRPSWQLHSIPKTSEISLRLWRSVSFFSVCLVTWLLLYYYLAPPGHWFTYLIFISGKAFFFSLQQRIKKKFQIWIQDLENAGCLNTVPYCDKYSYWNFTPVSGFGGLSVLKLVGVTHGVNHERKGRKKQLWALPPAPSFILQLHKLWV